ncbi:hypothetical protein F4678DRAFT_441392 [Xylaria arbuscula]|nr:hypothetical protein F4678DRAFT_441392 [Xylaria arbuscula]
MSVLQQMQPPQWVFDELKEIADIEFRFQRKLPAVYFTSMICSVMQKPLPRQWLLYGESLLQQFITTLSIATEVIESRRRCRRL